MFTFDNLLIILELLGIAAFAVTGAMKAVEKEMDIFGVIVLAIITALGGGFIRDILMNRLPVSLNSPSYFAAALAGGLVAIPAIQLVHKYFLWINVFDAIGLALFSITGAVAAMNAGLNFISVLLLGTMSGIGGGVLRDVLANDVPLVFRKEIYALASITGIVGMWLLARIAMLRFSVCVMIGIAIVLAVRLWAVYYNISLPNIRVKSTEK
ncbi:MAG: trimeric intracellular cation channel family protein [Elusimicrobiota bacterium]